MPQRSRTNAFGRRFAPDARDNNYRMLRLVTPAALLPSRRTYRFRGDVRDQIGGTCVGHGGWAWEHCAPIELTKSADDPYELYRGCVRVDEWADNDHEADAAELSALQAGTSVRALMRVLTARGHAKSYVWGFQAEEVARFLLVPPANAGPVVVGGNWYSTFNRPDTDGIVRLGPTASIEGGHCWLVRGYNRARGLFGPMVNSWGERWGKGGEFSMPGEVFERLLHEDGEAASAIQQRLKPRAVDPPGGHAVA